MSQIEQQEYINKVIQTLVKNKKEYIGVVFVNEVNNQIYSLRRAELSYKLLESIGW